MYISEVKYRTKKGNVSTMIVKSSYNKNSWNSALCAIFPIFPWEQAVRRLFLLGARSCMSHAGCCNTDPLLGPEKAAAHVCLHKV